MATEKENGGALFTNQKKNSPKHPDMTGQIDVLGRKFWISGWWKPGKDGKDDFISLAVQEVQDNQGIARNPGGQAQQGNQRRSGYQGGNQQPQGGYNRGGAPQGGGQRSNPPGNRGGEDFNDQQEPGQRNRW